MVTKRNRQRAWRNLRGVELSAESKASTKCPAVLPSGTEAAPSKTTTLDPMTKKRLLFPPLALRLPLALAMLGLLTSLASAAPRVILISLDGANPAILDPYAQSNALPPNFGLRLLEAKGVKASRNNTINPSLTAAAHVAIATGSSAAANDVVANAFQYLASPFNGSTISGFGAAIGGYSLDGPTDGVVTSEPLWLALRGAGKTVATATWPGGDGVNVTIPGLTGPVGSATNPIIQPASERTVDYTVPFGASTTPFQRGFTLNGASFSPAPAGTVNQLTAAGKTFYGTVMQANLETFTSGTPSTSYDIKMAAYDTTNDGVVNYDSVVIFNQTEGIQPGPFSLPSTGPAYIKPGTNLSALFYYEGHAQKAGTRYFVSNLAPDLSVVRAARTSASYIPRTSPVPAVIANVDDINNNVGFWQPQADFRIVEKLDATPSTFLNFPDPELEAIYMDLVREFVTYQTNVGLRAISNLPNADLVMIYLEQPDGSAHQFLLTDPRQGTDFTNPNSIGAGQDPVKKARYAAYLQTAYQAANNAVQRIIDNVGTDVNGRPNSNIMVTSDHGFAPFHTQVQMTQILTNAGITGIGSSATSRVKVVTSGPAVNIYINLQGREPGTPPVSRTEYITLQKQIANALRAARDTNPIFAGPSGKALFDKVYTRPLPADINDPSFGRRTTAEIGQDSGDVYALLDIGYNFDGRQTPAITRQGDSSNTVLSQPNFYGAHGYDPAKPEMSAVFYAAGPDILPGTLGEMSNIDIAPTIERILGVTPARTVQGEAMILGPAPLTLLNAGVRKTHGTAGAFDFLLPLSGTPGIEPRAGQSGKPALVLGHRGASGYRPEHTLASYQVAIDFGADFIEPDLVLTKDGVPIARHEPLFGATAVNGTPVTVPNEYTTTNIFDHPEFADRLRTRNLDGTNVTGFWADDFTLAEVKTLFARERIPATRSANTAYNDLYRIPTLQEVIDLAKANSTPTRTIGIYPETKHPTFFLQNAANRTNPARFEDTVVATLHANFGNTPTAPVLLQSFEVSNLQYLATQTSIRKIQLMNTGSTRPYDFVVAGDTRTYNDLATPAGLDFMNDYAWGIGPTRDLIIPRPGNVLGTPTALIANAHAAGLQVHAFTFRAENNFLSTPYRIGSDLAAYGDYVGETVKYLNLGLDGFFTDQADFGVRAVKATDASAHLLVFTFSNPVVSGSAAVTSGTGAATAIFGGNEMRVNLTGVTDGQKVTVTLTNVKDSLGNTLPSVSLTVGFLLGDVNRDGVVNDADVAESKATISTPATIDGLNAHADIKLDGKLNVADTAAVKANLGHTLAP